CSFFSFLLILSPFSLLHFNFIFFLITTAYTIIYILSLHDALPIYMRILVNSWMTTGYFNILMKCQKDNQLMLNFTKGMMIQIAIDRKSTRLNSSHVKISYAVFCLKKKTKFNNNKSRILNNNIQFNI